MKQNQINGVGVKINDKLGGVVSKTDVLKAIYIDNTSK
jgi:thymidine phosphorylase